MICITVQCGGTLCLCKKKSDRKNNYNLINTFIIYNNVTVL